MTIVCPLPYPLFFFLLLNIPSSTDIFFWLLDGPCSIRVFLWLFDVACSFRLFMTFWCPKLYRTLFKWLLNVPCSFCLFYNYRTSLVLSTFFMTIWRPLLFLPFVCLSDVPCSIGIVSLPVHVPYSIRHFFFTLEVPSFIRLVNDRRTSLALYVILTCYRMSQALQPFF